MATKLRRLAVQLSLRGKPTRTIELADPCISFRRNCNALGHGLKAKPIEPQALALFGMQSGVTGEITFVSMSRHEAAAYAKTHNFVT